MGLNPLRIQVRKKALCWKKAARAAKTDNVVRLENGNKILVAQQKYAGKP